MSKSFLSKIAEYILKNTKPKYMDSYDEINKFLNEKLENEDKPFKSIFKTHNINGVDCVTFGDKNKNTKVLYIHGGAYIGELNYQHLFYCYFLARKLDAYIIVPIYPLAPKHTYKESYDLLEKIYPSLEGNIIIMGDSAGGSLALGFCQYLKTINLAQPSNIVVFSPWVDISMSDEYNSNEDVILGDIGLREIGKVWAGDLDTKDYKVSPLYGDNKGLANTLIFTGTGEIFYNDILKYTENLRRDNVNVKLIEGEDLFHIYPLFPIPEARSALKEIKKEIIG